MRIIINQPAMLGDLLFIEPIVRHYLDVGNKVTWAIKDQYYWLVDYIMHPNLKIVRQSELDIDYECAEIIEDEESIYMPLRFATPIYRNEEDKHSGAYHEHFMLDKYRLLSLPLSMWHDLKWKRNYIKEDYLFNKLGLKEGQKYTLVNKYMKDIYEVQPEIDKLQFDGKIIQLRPIDGFTLLDWTKIIIEATYIHTVETALIYMVEVLPIKAKEIHMYPRLPYQQGFTGVKNFISDKWILH